MANQVVASHGTFAWGNGSVKFSSPIVKKSVAKVKSILFNFVFRKRSEIALQVAALIVDHQQVMLRVCEEKTVVQSREITDWHNRWNKIDQAITKMEFVPEDYRSYKFMYHHLKTLCNRPSQDFCGEIPKSPTSPHPQSSVQPGILKRKFDSMS